VNHRTDQLILYPIPDVAKQKKHSPFETEPFEVPIVGAYAPRHHFPAARGDVAFEEQRQRFPELLMGVKSADHFTEAGGGEVGEGEAQAVVQILGPADRVRGLAAEEMADHHLGREHEFETEEPEPEAHFVIHAAAVEQTAIPAAGGIERGAAHSQAATGEDGRGEGGGGAARKPADVQIGAGQLEAVAFGFDTLEVRDSARGGANLGIVQEVQKGLMPEFGETDVGVGEDHDAALGVSHAQIAGAGDAHGRRGAGGYQLDAAAAPGERRGGTVGGAVIDDDDFGVAGKRVFQVLDGAAQLGALVAADHDHADARAEGHG
jgi:hypothetical protein